MNISQLMGSLCLAACAAAAGAQTAADFSQRDISQRDINQQTRIRNGLQDGSLTTREAAVLERKEGRLDRLQAEALRDGKLSDPERARINRAEDRVSADIRNARHNGVQGDPLSASSQRMQQGVQRDIQQQQRIQDGLQSGQLSNREVAGLERGQARQGARQFRAGRDGHVSGHEAQAIDNAQNASSQRIHQLRHNASPSPQ